jgi:hypothetical protein
MGLKEAKNRKDKFDLWFLLSELLYMISPKCSNSLL